MKRSTKVKEVVLLLGGNGFIGKNVIDFIIANQEISLKYKLVVLSRSGDEGVIDNIDYVRGDYGDKCVLIELFSKWNFTRVFHFATSTTPLSSGNNVLSDINGNLLATIGLLEIMREFGCRSIMYLSSGGAVYGEKQLNKISENEVCDPVSSYGVVKLTIENYIRLYKRQYDIDYLILRVSNPFGKFHASEKQGVINIAIRRALRGEAVEIWGDGEQSKDYIYVDDLVGIIFQLLEQNVVNRTINVGSGKSYRLNLILETVKLFLPNLRVNYVDSKTTDVKDFYLDISLMNSLGIFKFTEFKKAIEQTILFEREQLNLF